MPTISVTEDEYNAFYYFMRETQEKAEGTFDEQYGAEFEKKYASFLKFSDKFKNAQSRDRVQKAVKNLKKYESIK